MTWKPVVFFGLAAFLAIANPLGAAPSTDDKKTEANKAEGKKDEKDVSCGCVSHEHGAEDKDHHGKDEAKDEKGHHKKCKKHHHHHHGTVFTTDVAGTLVHGDIYDRADDVYLNGAPPFGHLKHWYKKDDKASKDKGKDDKERDEKIHGRHWKEGLRDGLYYFQVTNPNGSRLLSLRPLAERQVEVRDGYIQGGTTSHGLVTLESPFPRGYTIVQLAPFNPTDHKYGEYRVWLTPVAAYRAGEGAFGFSRHCSRTDTFKVRVSTAASTISGFVFHDRNRNRIFDQTTDPPETTVASVSMQIFVAGSSTPLDTSFTGSLGGYGFQVSPSRYPATYEIRAAEQNWTAPTQRPVLQVKLTAPGSAVTHVDFGVVYLGETHTNVPMTTWYWAGVYGQTIIRDVLWTSDAEPLPFVLRAGILQQTACPSHGLFTSLEQVSDFLTLNAYSENALCSMAAHWLSLSLAQASDGIPLPVDPDYFWLSFTVDTASIDATVYLGLDPTTGEPVFMTLGDLLSLVASDFGGFDPAYQAFYRLALQNAAGNATFVVDYPGGGA